LSESSGHDAAVAPLTSEERAELARLRQEVEQLRVAATRPRRRIHWKSVTAGVFIVLGCILAPIALASVWLHNQVSETDRFVATMSPLIREPSVQAALTDRVTETVFSYVDVQGLASDAVDALAAQGLPPAIADRLQALTGPLAVGVRNFVHSNIAELFASEQFAQAWDQVLRVVHEQTDAALSGAEDSALTIRGDDVVLDLAPFIERAKQRLVERGFEAANRVPEVHPTIAVTDADRLVRAQTAYTLLDRLATWLPWIALVLLAVGVYLARNHRRALLATGLGFAASMLVLAVTLTVFRSVLVSSVPSRAAAPAADTYDLVIRFLRSGLRTLLVLGLIVAIGAFLAGPSVTAVRIRGAVTRSMAWLRTRGARAGVRTGPVGDWVYAHRSVLRGATIGLAVLMFVFIDRPSAANVLVIAVVLAVCLVVIQFLAQPPAERAGPAGGHASG
jgi:hypothetical protein